jgi:hypothetical protein
MKDGSLLLQQKQVRNMKQNSAKTPSRLSTTASQSRLLVKGQESTFKLNTRIPLAEKAINTKTKLVMKTPR